MELLPVVSAHRSTIQINSDMLKQTQTEFWAVNMGKPPAYDPIKETEYMVTGDLAEAETDGVLQLPCLDLSARK